MVPPRAQIKVKGVGRDTIVHIADAEMVKIHRLIGRQFATVQDVIAHDPNAIVIEESRANTHNGLTVKNGSNIAKSGRILDTQLDSIIVQSELNKHQDPTRAEPPLSQI